MKRVGEAVRAGEVERVRVPVHVRHDQVEASVTRVEPGRAHRPSGVVEAEVGGDVDETVVAQILEESVGSIAHREEQVEVTVAVVVDPGGLARRARRELEADGRGHVREAGVQVVAIQRGDRLASCVPEEEIRVAVRVEVSPGAGPDRPLDHEADVGGDVLEAVHQAVAVEAAGGAVEADEAVGVTIQIEVRPRVRERATVGEEIRLDRGESNRLGGVSAARGDRDGKRGDGEGAGPEDAAAGGHLSPLPRHVPTGRGHPRW